MTATLPLRFDPNTLRRIAGDAAYARGEAYFRNRTVDILSIEPDQVLARVAGSETYRTLVTGGIAAIGGECSCPAFDREGFCKHMVAVALAANAAAGEAGVGDVLGNVRAYLETRSADVLAGMIVDIAGRDPALLRKLEVAAALAGSDGKALETQLRAAIEDAIHMSDYVDYWEADGWAAGVDAALDMLDEIARGPRAALARELAEDAITGIEEAIGHIDDSDGHCSALLAHAQRIHLDSCRAAPPDPLALAEDLFMREMEGEYGTFDGAAVEYENVLGKEGLAEYRRLAQKAWDERPSRIGPIRGGNWYRSGDYALTSILDFFAERDGDVEMRIALRSKDLSSTRAFLKLAEFCLEHGREADALRRAEEGLWLFEDDRPDERLVFFAVDLLLKADRKADAQAHLWRAFEKEPSLRLYGKLRKLGGEAAMRRAIGFLQQKLTRTSSTRWYQQPTDLLISVMLEEEMYEAAWTIVRNHGASRSTKDALARASEAAHAAEALAVYAEQVEELAQRGGNPAYEEAVALIARMGTLRTGAEQETYVADIKVRYARKRNLMKLLG